MLHLNLDSWKLHVSCVIQLWWSMMTSSNGNIFRVTGHLCGEFTGPGEFPAQKPVTQSFDVFFDLRLNKRLSKQSWGWWSETLLSPLWRHRNANLLWKHCGVCSKTPGISQMYLLYTHALPFMSDSKWWQYQISMSNCRQMILLSMCRTNQNRICICIYIYIYT